MFFFLIFKKNLFIYLFLAALGPSFCERAFCSCGKQGPPFIAVRGPLTIVASLIAEHRLQTRRLSNCGSRAQLLRGMWDPPRPGLEPVSPAPGGRLSTTAPPGKPWMYVFRRACYVSVLNLEKYIFLYSIKKKSRIQLHIHYNCNYIKISYEINRKEIYQNIPVIMLDVVGLDIFPLFSIFSKFLKSSITVWLLKSLFEKLLLFSFFLVFGNLFQPLYTQGSKNFAAFIFQCLAKNVAKLEFVI